jgi:hypothetical protein
MAKPDLNSILEDLKNIQTELNALEANWKPTMLKEIQGISVFLKVFQNKKQLSDKISNENLLAMECMILHQMIEDAKTSKDISEDDLKILESVQPKFKKLSEEIKTNLSQYTISNTALKELLPKLLFDLPWEGNHYLTFQTPERLGQIVARLCEAKMAVTSCDSVSFKINLPQLTEHEAEVMKNSGETKEGKVTQYAKMAFQSAAKQGFSPDKCNITIDGVKISSKESRFDGIRDEWEKLAQEKQKQLRNDTWSTSRGEPAPSSISKGP